MVPTTLGLVVRYAASAFDRQLHLMDLVGELDWHVDLAAGTLSFGDRYRWSVQMLGTESGASHTWLWAWANPGGLPDELVGAALALRQFGEEHGIPELVEPRSSLDRINGHLLSLIASGLVDADAYYRAPYEGGAAFLLIRCESFPRLEVEDRLARIATVFPQAISALDIPDHKLALASYLGYYDLNHADQGDRLVVEVGGSPVMTATFDAQGRLTQLQVMLGGESKSPSLE